MTKRKLSAEEVAERLQNKLDAYRLQTASRHAAMKREYDSKKEALKEERKQKRRIKTIERREKVRLSLLKDKYKKRTPEIDTLDGQIEVKHQGGNKCQCGDNRVIGELYCPDCWFEVKRGELSLQFEKAQPTRLQIKAAESRVVRKGNSMS